LIFPQTVTSNKTFGRWDQPPTGTRDVHDPPHPLRVGQAPGAQRGHDRADAGAADHVDGHPGLLQRPDYAQVG
jgi:hypothetical protein